MTKTFSFKAEKIWRAIPESQQEAILTTVWCGECRNSTTIVDFAAEMVGDFLLLIGKCQVCGNEVRRVID